jgi:hypothetical protein
MRQGIVYIIYAKSGLWMWVSGGGPRRDNGTYLVWIWDEKGSRGIFLPII